MSTARAMVLSIDGRAELVVTDAESGATARYELEVPSLALLSETAAGCLANALRAIVAGLGGASVQPPP